MSYPRNEQDFTFSATGPSANGSSDAAPVGHLKDLGVEISGTFTATAQVEGKLTASGPWVSIGSALTAPGVVAVTLPFYAIRVTISGFGTGAVVARFVGRLAQT